MDNPYVGLRPYNREDAQFFFGRREQTGQLLERLYDTGFLAVVGSSGCGKSSLIRAGLIPALLGGFLVEKRSKWRIGVMKPGNAPLYNLAAALCDVGEDGKPDPEQLAELHEALGAGAKAIMDWLAPRLGSDTNQLLLVDQFEEIFAYRGSDVDSARSVEERQLQMRHRTEAADLVDAIVSLGEREDLPLYVVLTMRTDFLGDCDVFYGLPEALNRGRYLVPRLTRSQLRETIAGPTLLSGARLSPRLLDHLLNQLGDRMDRLPVLQHALFRTWETWHNEGEQGEIDWEHYERAGKLEGALSAHAEEALREVDREAAERIFKCLTDTDAGKRRVRRPATVNELATVSCKSVEEVDAVVTCFHGRGRNFVYRSEGPWEDNPRIDIAHESLIRQWPRLRRWVDEEHDMAARFRETVRLARLEEHGEESLLQEPALSRAEILHKRIPTEAWASRYSDLADDYTLATKYLSRSRRELLRRKRARVTGVALAFAVLAVISIWANSARSAAEDAKQRADDSLKVAKIAREEAVTAAREANDQALVGLASAWSERDPTHAALVLLMVENPGETNYATAAMLKALGRPFTRFELTGHMDRITASAVSPDGERLITASNDYTARIWDTREGRVVARIADHKWGIGAVAFDPLGRFVATAGPDGARIRDASTGSVLASLDPPGDGDPPAKVVIAFSPGGNELAIARGSTARIWRWGSDEKPRKLIGHEGTIHTILFDASETRIVTACEDGTAYIWDRFADVEPVVLAGHQGPVLTAVFSSDGALVGTGSEDSTARIWDAATGEQLFNFDQHSDAVLAVVFAEGRRFVTGSKDKAAIIWDALSGRRLRTLVGHSAAVRTVRVNDAGTRILTGSDDGTAMLWDAADGRYISTLRGHEGALCLAAFAPDETRFLTASADRSARVWSPPPDSLSAHRKEILSISMGGVRDDGRLATSSADGTARLWHSTSGAAIGLLSEPPVVVASLTRDGRRAATGTAEGTISIWDTATGSELRRLVEHTSAITVLAFSRDGARIAAGADDGTTRTWDVESGAVVNSLPPRRAPISSIVFSSDGARIATGVEDGKVHVWDVTSGDKRAAFSLRSRILALAFADDDAQLVTVSEAGYGVPSVVVWDIATREARHKLGFGERIRSAEFSDDAGRALLLSYGTAELWDTQSGKRLNRWSGESATLSRDGLKVALRDGGKPARVIDLTTGKTTLLKPPTAPTRKIVPTRTIVTAVEFTPDSKSVLYTASDGSTRLHGLQPGQKDRMLRGFGLGGFGLGATMTRFSDDGTLLLSHARDGTARVWDVAGGARRFVIGGREGPIPIVVVSRDGARAVTASEDGTLRVWDAATALLLRRLRGHSDAVLTVSFDDAGARIVTGSADGSVRIWNLESGEESRSRKVGAPVLHAALSSKRALVAIGTSKGGVLTWDLTNDKLRTLESTDEPVSSLVFAPNGTSLLVTQGELEVHVVDATSGAPILTLKHMDPVMDASFSDDGSRIVTISRDEAKKLDHVQVWDAREKSPPATIVWEPDVSAAVFRPGTLQLITASSNPTKRAYLARIWNPQGKEGLRLVHGAPVDRLAVSPDGSSVATASGSAARLWPISVNVLKTRLENLTQVCLPGEFRQKYLEEKPDLRVPDVKGLPLREAEHTLANAGFKIDWMGEPASIGAPGSVQNQDPDPGRLEFRGATIFVVVDGAPLAAVPDVTGKSQADAVRLLKAAGLTWVSGGRRIGPEARGTIVAQRPRPASPGVARGTHVVLYSSVGLDPPDVTGQPIELARHALAELGLSVEVKPGEKDARPGTVLEQSPPTSAGQPVVLTVQIQPTTVPYLVGLSLDAARTEIERAGLQVDVSWESDAGKPSGTVLSQARRQGIRVATGERIRIVCSWRPSAAASVPDDAIATLWMADPRDLRGKMLRSPLQVIVGPLVKAMETFFPNSRGINDALDGETVFALRARALRARGSDSTEMLGVFAVSDRRLFIERMQKLLHDAKQEEIEALKVSNENVRIVHLESQELDVFVALAGRFCFVSTTRGYLIDALRRSGKATRWSPGPRSPLLVELSRHREAGHDAFVAIDLERVESILPVPEGSPLRKAFRLLRGSSLRELDLGLKFDAEKREFTCIVHLPLTGEPDGLLRALTAPDFKATAIPNVPPHAEFFVTASLDLQHGTDLLLELVRLVIGEDARASMEEFSGMPVQESSAALGHRLSLFLGSSNLPGEVFGEYGAFTFEMRDAAVFRRIIKTALGDSTRMERTEFAGATIYTDSDVTFAIGKRQFLFASGRDSAEDALRQGNRSPRQLGPESALPAPSGPVNALLFATPRGVSALLEELFDIEPPSMSDVAQRTVTPTGILGPVRIVGRWLPDHGYELELVLKFR